jgi:hypothetical protein
MNIWSVLVPFWFNHHNDTNITSVLVPFWFNHHNITKINVLGSIRLVRVVYLRGKIGAQEHVVCRLRRRIDATHP